MPLDKVCEHVNLPFQAGDDAVLDTMRRGYTNSEYRHAIEKMRDRIPNVSLATDLIVGFCGETDDQFAKSLQLIEDIKFDKVHAAAYSTRKGTIADRTMVDDVPHDVKQSRLKQIEAAQESISTQINSRYLGDTVQILVEGRKRGKWFGRNRNDKLVYFENSSDRVGELVDIRIDQTSPWSLQGTLLS